jgi:hypothetical protein
MMNKFCAVCNQDKPFTLRGSCCKDCANLRSKEHYAKVKGDPELKEKYRQRINEQNRARKQQTIQYLGGCCSDCKGTFHDSVYDFHHVDMSSKEGNPSKFIAGSWDKAKTELDKCVLLCSNCHRLRHFGANVL